MGLLLKIGIGILLALGLLLLATRVYSAFPTNGKPLSFSLAPVQAKTLAAATTNTSTPLKTSGVLVVDKSHGEPGIPYLVYRAPTGKVAVKQLFFGGDKNCNVAAGALPCVRNLDGSLPSSEDTLPVAAGTPITITGSMDQQMVSVDSYEKATSTPGMIIFSAAKGQKIVLSTGFTLTPTEVLQNAGCTFGVGCYGDSVQRVAVTFTAGKSIKNTELLIGRTFLYKDMTITLIAIAENQEIPVFKFLAALNK